MVKNAFPVYDEQTYFFPAYTLRRDKLVTELRERSGVEDDPSPELIRLYEMITPKLCAAYQAGRCGLEINDIFPWITMDLV